VPDKVTDKHAAAAARLVMLQMALERTSVSGMGDSDLQAKVVTAMQGLDEDSFWGVLNNSTNGQNPPKARTP
jgi:hypothetical protein